MTVAQALADFEAGLSALEHALANGGLVSVPAFVPVDLTGSVTNADLQRLETAMGRLAECQQRLEQRGAEMAGELAEISRRRGAAVAYASND